eukprot:19025_5
MTICFANQSMNKDSRTQSRPFPFHTRIYIILNGHQFALGFEVVSWPIQGLKVACSEVRGNPLNTALFACSCSQNLIVVLF